MIVKDEAHIIEKTLRNIVQHIPISTYVICDTGSNDNTIQIIKKVMDEQDINGEILQHEWKNFEHNRNLALQAARGKAEYAFIFDADDYINCRRGCITLPHKLEAPGYNFKFYSPGCAYVRPLLIKLIEPWEFEGVVHECLSHPHSPNLITIDGDYTIESGRIGNRNKDPHKYEKDALLLENAYNDNTTKKRLLSRYAFYCGQSWVDAGKLEKGIEWYKKCVFELANWTEEKYYSCYRIGQCLTCLGKPEEAVFYYLLASDFSIERLEAIVEAAKIYYSKGKHRVGYLLLRNYSDEILSAIDVPYNSLFAPQDIYKYEALVTLAIGSYYYLDTEMMTKCVIEMYNRCAKEFNLSFAEALLQGSEFYFAKMRVKEIQQARQLFSNVKLVLKRHAEIRDIEITHHIREKFDVALLSCLTSACDVPTETITSLSCDIKYPKVIATTTTCRRLDCFIKTMKSVIDCFMDFNRISSWYVIDDNSCESDKAKMKELFPFINLIEKTEDQKGHRKSMNIIHDILMRSDVDYWLHLEDDWLFLKRDNYVIPAIECLESRVGKSLNVKQILFNKGYGETVGDIITPIGSVFLPEDNSILLHVQNQGVSIPSCSYWAHYSFRPSICSVSAIRSLGNFDSNNVFFEGDYATKYCEHGYRSAYFNDITCIHIGKLSGVRGIASNKLNAYEINNVCQFAAKKTEQDKYQFDTQENKSLVLENTIDPINFAYEHLSSYSEYTLTDQKNCIVTTYPSNGTPIVKLSDILPENVLFDEHDELIFVEGWDIVGHDAEFIRCRDVNIMRRHARQTPHCLAFNTLGFTKHSLDKLMRSPYFGTGDGIYIKKSALKEYHI